jgi:hypothetical protein
MPTRTYESRSSQSPYKHLQNATPRPSKRPSHMDPRQDTPPIQHTKHSAPYVHGRAGELTKPSQHRHNNPHPKNKQIDTHRRNPTSTWHSTLNATTTPTPRQPSPSPPR